MTWYVFDKEVGLLGTVEAISTVDAAIKIGKKWGFHRIKQRVICWNIHPKPLWEMWQNQ
jgi:hypothetical protein